MAWTTPNTWTAALVTVAQFNTYIRDNLLAVFPSGPTWISPTFSAGDFTASGSMTWTVGSGDVSTYKYTVCGKSMTVAFNIGTSTVGGTPSTALRIAIPGGATSATGSVYNAYMYSDNGGATAHGIAEVSGSTAFISLYKIGATNWTAATNTTQVYGQITFEIA